MEAATEEKGIRYIKALEPITRYSGVSYSSLEKIDKQILEILVKDGYFSYEQELKCFLINSLSPNPMKRRLLIKKQRELSLLDTSNLVELAERKIQIYRVALKVPRLNQKLRLLIALLIRRDEWLHIKQLASIFDSSVLALRPHLTDFQDLYDVQVDDLSNTFHYKLPSEYTDLCKEQVSVLG